LKKAKIIISHDIDHLQTKDHFNDFYLPKYITKSLLEWICFRINTLTLVNRFVEICGRDINNVESLIEFNLDKKIPLSFFVAVTNGRSLGYSNKDAKEIVEKILQKNGNIYLHAISKKSEGIEVQLNKFKNLFGVDCKGIRYHYLSSKIDYQKLKENNVKFDSSIASDEEFSINNGVIEFPVHIMDSACLTENKYLSISETKINVEIVLDKINKWNNLGRQYVIINFHDRYFSKSFPGWMRWYKDLIRALEVDGYKFVSFEEAVNEIEAIAS
jgi:hypothetical protein